jgi:hypothetical protein
VVVTLGFWPARRENRRSVSRAVDSGAVVGGANVDSDAQHQAPLTVPPAPPRPERACAAVLSSRRVESVS